MFLIRRAKTFINTFDNNNLIIPSSRACVLNIVIVNQLLLCPFIVSVRVTCVVMCLYVSDIVGCVKNYCAWHFYQYYILLMTGKNYLFP